MGNAPPGRRATCGSVPRIGLGPGPALGTGVLEVLDEETFPAVGRRAAFVLSMVLVAVGLCWCG